MTTRANLIITTADMLGISEVGQALSTEDSNKVGRYIDSSCAFLRGKGYVNVDPSEEVADEIELPLAQYCAYKAASAYNMNPQVLLQKFNMPPDSNEGLLIGNITAAIEGKPEFEVMKANFF